jgi:hypothetical protein
LLVVLVRRVPLFIVALLLLVQILLPVILFSVFRRRLYMPVSDAHGLSSPLWISLPDGVLRSAQRPCPHAQETRES